MVFATSEGRALHFMSSNSSISRAKTVELLDISDAEALVFLKNVLEAEGIKYDDGKLKDYIAKYAGRRFKSLLKLMNKNGDLEGM